MARQPRVLPRIPPQDPLAQVDGCSLECFARVSRDLVRAAARGRADADVVLARHGLSWDRWVRIRETWSARIRLEDSVRDAFRLLYARPDRAAIAHDLTAAPAQDPERRGARGPDRGAVVPTEGRSFPTDRSDAT